MIEDRCVNLPSWSLPTSLINKVITEADASDRSQSSILREALEEWFEAHSPTDDAEDVIQLDKN